MFRCAAMRCEVDVWARVAAAAGQPPILAPRAHSLESVRVRVRATKRAPFLLAAGHGVWARGELRCWGGHACARGMRCTRHDVAFLQLVCDEGMPPFPFCRPYRPQSARPRTRDDATSTLLLVSLVSLL